MRIQVLLAYERALIRQGLRAILEKNEDIEVIAEAPDADTALAEASRAHPQVVVMNATLPERGGTETTKALRATEPAPAVVVLTFHDSGALLHDIVEAGALGCLDRDASGEELVAAVREAAAGRRYLGKGIAERMAEASKRPGLAGSLETLTDKERSIIRLIAAGASNAEAAEQMKLSPRTVETYRIRLMRKLELDHLPALVKFAIRQGLATLD